MQNKRWYDIDVIVSKATSIIEQSTDEVKLGYAKFIIQEAKNYGITIKGNELDDKFNYVLKRWYDKDKTISDSFEYLKNCSEDLRHEICLQIIEQADNQIS